MRNVNEERNINMGRVIPCTTIMIIIKIGEILNWWGGKRDLTWAE